MLGAVGEIVGNGDADGHEDEGKVTPYTNPIPIHTHIHHGAHVPVRPDT